MAIDAPTYLEPPPPPPPPSRTRGPVTVIVVAALVIAAVGVLAFVRSGGSDDGARNSDNWHGTLIEPGRQRPSFTLTDTSGQPYDFAAQSSGKTTFLFFGYTNCPDVCPTTMANLTAAIDSMSGTAAKVVFVTTDPSRDTPERLAQWLALFPGDVVGLTGSVPELEAAQKAAGISTAIAAGPNADGSYSVEHSASIMAYTPDDQEHLIFPSGLGQTDWVQDIPRMAAVPAWNRVDGIVAVNAYAGPSTLGQSAVYLTVVNGGADNAVVGVSSRDASGATMHVTDAAGVMTDADELDVASGGSTTLAPGANHVMLSGLDRDLVEGDTVTVVLKMKDGPDVTVVVPVVGFDALADRAPGVERHRRLVVTDGGVLAVTWWCQSSALPWSWTPKVYLGVWVMVSLLVVPYAVVMRRRARTHGLDRRDKRAILWFALGTLFLWSASDWPLGTLGAGYLLSVHTVLYLIYTMAAAPLLLIGIPGWMARGLLDRLRAWGVYRTAVRPWVAVLVLNGALVFTHIPAVVNLFRASQLGSFGLDFLWLVSGVVGWLPIITPFRGDRIKAPIWKCVYLFIAFGAFPMLPGALITFAPLPLYRVYELAPRFGDWTPLDDQQLAGALMKVGNIPILWAVIAAIFVKSALEGSRDDLRVGAIDLDDPRVIAARASAGGSVAAAADRASSTPVA